MNWLVDISNQPNACLWPGADRSHQPSRCSRKTSAVFTGSSEAVHEWPDSAPKHQKAVSSNYRLISGGRGLMLHQQSMTLHPRLRKRPCAWGHEFFRCSKRSHEKAPCVCTGLLDSASARASRQRKLAPCKLQSHGAVNRRAAKRKAHQAADHAQRRGCAISSFLPEAAPRRFHRPAHAPALPARQRRPARRLS